MRYHPVTIIGLIITCLATIFYVYVSLEELLANQATVPFLFLMLLLLMVAVAIIGWFTPDGIVILTAFCGVMLSTYNGVNADRENWLPALVTGTPFILAAILIYVGVKILERAQSE
jgi:hypothetical protein